MIVLLCFVGALATVLALAVEHRSMKAVDSKAWRSRMRELASPFDSERCVELQLWNDGEHERNPIPYAEGERYVLGSGVDEVWVRGLMESDDRLRAWNGKRPRGLAISRRRD